MRVNQGQELVIGGYTPSPKNFDALEIGLLHQRTADVRGPHPQRLHPSVASRPVLRKKSQPTKNQ
jgi:hypothetical protein